MCASSMPAFVFALALFNAHHFLPMHSLSALAAPLFYRWFKSIMRFLFKVSWVSHFFYSVTNPFSFALHFYPFLSFTFLLYSFFFLSLLLLLQKGMKKKIAISLWFLVSFRSKLSLCGLTAAYMLNTMIFLHFCVQTNDSQNPNLYFALFHRCHSFVCFFFFSSLFCSLFFCLVAIVVIVVTRLPQFYYYSVLFILAIYIN